MYIEQADLLRGMDRDFLKKLIEITTKESFSTGDILFREGDQARFFYILLKGDIKLSIGETGHVFYTVSHPGEAFGWSCLVGRNAYSASAECRAPTKLLRIESDSLQELVEKNPANGLIFFRRLAWLLGNRLINSYRVISSGSQAEISPALGTGQVLESLEMV